ncbi:MAG: hypothetical protein KatS3mg050_0882 [Litorilinea sp.]|nr:MAG: hypothetical protein KatS3mg050_0882 [Litorilinea sp.]
MMAGRLHPAIRNLYLTSGALFVLSGLVGVWAAADRDLAWMRFVMLSLAWLGSAVPLVVRHGRSGVLALAGLMAAVAAGLAGGSLFLGLLPGENVAAALVTLLPLGLGGLQWLIQRGQLGWAWPTGLSLAAAVAALAVAQERSAWIALGAGLCLAALLRWRHGPARLLRWPWAVDLAGLAGILGVAGLWVGLSLRPELIAGGWNRPVIWHDALILLQDYPLTGVGLGQTAMVLSSYVYLFHVPFLYQTYNLFLQVAVEQGLPGLFGFVGLVAAGAAGLWQAYGHPRRTVRHWANWVAVSLGGTFAFGLVNAGLYSSWLAPLLFVPLGFALWLPALATGLKLTAGLDLDRPELGGLGGYLAALVPLIPVAALALLLTWPGIEALLEANLAAVAQTRAELSLYRWPQWPIQDELRRSDRLDLREALARYQKTLAIAPTNVTAHRRLGQIALSRGQYELARRHLAAAFQLAPDQRPVRQMLGEVYAVLGQEEAAVNIWQGGNADPHKLELRQWWYSHIGAGPESQSMDQAIHALKRALQANPAFRARP